MNAIRDGLSWWRRALLRFRLPEGVAVGRWCGMADMSRVLAARSVQPGHDRRWVSAELQAFEMCRRLLPPDRYDVHARPADLANLYLGPDGRAVGGMVPDLKVTDRATGRYVFVEVKRQGPAGNAHERAARAFTIPFVALLADRTGLDYHPYVVLMCEDLATRPRYLAEHASHLPAGAWLAWADYDPVLLGRFLDQLRERWLDPGSPPRPSACSIAATLDAPAGTCAGELRLPFAG